MVIVGPWVKPKLVAKEVALSGARKVVPIWGIKYTFNSLGKDGNPPVVVAIEYEKFEDVVGELINFGEGRSPKVTSGLITGGGLWGRYQFVYQS